MREMQEDYFLSGLAFHLTNEKTVALSFCINQQSLQFNTRGTEHHREKNKKQNTSLSVSFSSLCPNYMIAENIPKII